MNLFFLIFVIALFALVFFAIIKRRRKIKRGSSLVVATDSRADSLSARLSGLLHRSEINESFWSELEVTLVEADVGIAMTERLIAAARSGKTIDDVRRTLKEKMIEVFPKFAGTYETKPHVILVAGVNGVGKTTTIAKLARCHMEEGKKVLLVAADTFRAAAVEQLKEWGRRLNCEVISQAEGADSAAVAFDAVEKAKAKGYDVVIIDTAGRLHTKQNLMDELKKVARVIGKALPGAPHERVIVLDATVGSNGLAQARQFNESLNLTGVIVTKLDGTAKGGVVFAIAHELKIPITHIGLGEKMDDLKPFDAREFVESVIG